MHLMVITIVLIHIIKGHQRYSYTSNSDYIKAILENTDEVLIIIVNIAGQNIMNS